MLARLAGGDAVPNISDRKCGGMAVIDACGTWVADLMAQGWDAYLATLMFHDLPGSMQAQIAQMRQAAMGMFSRLVTRTVRHPRSPKMSRLLPRAVFAPDLPVSKRRTMPVDEPPANDGLHMHGIILANRLGRLREPLNLHVEQKLATYQTGRIRKIDIRPIDYAPERATAYALKVLKRPGFGPDDLLVLPRCLSELPLKVRGSL
jgi:hypothetical protein